MALVVEDGTGLANAESYVTVVEVDTYHANRNNTAWAAVASTALKEGYIRQAMDYLRQTYSLKWKGNRYALNQALDWPRFNVIRSDISPYFTLDSSVIPIELKNAVAELALKAVSGSLLPDISNPGVVKEAVGPLSREYAPGGSQKPRYGAIAGLLAPLLKGAGGVQVIRG